MTDLTEQEKILLSKLEKWGKILINGKVHLIIAFQDSKMVGAKINDKEENVKF